MPESLPVKRIGFGYATVVAVLLITFSLWIGAMWRADELYENAWKYPAKVGSHGTLILMCWAFILATRFRPIERLFGGLDKVYQAHRRIGECAFFLIFLHPIFLAVAYAERPGEFFRYLWFSGDWVRNTGLIALAIFTLLVVLSIYVKIAYHRWKRTHDFFGVLLVLVVIHAVIAEGEIMRYPVLMVWHGVWVALGLTAYVYIRFLYRFIGPQYDYVAQSVISAGDKITEIYLAPVGRALHLRPGQFIYVSFDAYAVSEEPHPFSVSSAPEEPNLRFSIKRLGDWTSNVAKIEPGERARVWGPYGHFGELLFKRPRLPVVMIGGGIGITPFLSIVGSGLFAGRTGRSTLIYSVSDQAAAIYAKELREYDRLLPNFSLKEHHSDEEGYIDRTYLEDVLDHSLPEYLFMLCGPPPMITSLKKLLSEAGVREKQIINEDFDIR